jgi:hypothetical protein
MNFAPFLCSFRYVHEVAVGCPFRPWQFYQWSGLFSGMILLNDAPKHQPLILRKLAVFDIFVS